MKYPTTKKDTTVKENYFGTEVSDPYRWLENDTSAETGAWVKAQNEVTENYLEQIPFRDKIRKRYENIFNYEKYSAPSKKGNSFTIIKIPVSKTNLSYTVNRLKARRPKCFWIRIHFQKMALLPCQLLISKDGSLAAYNISEGGSDWQKNDCDGCIDKTTSVIRWILNLVRRAGRVMMDFFTVPMIPSKKAVYLPG